MEDKTSLNETDKELLEESSLEEEVGETSQTTPEEDTSKKTEETGDKKFKSLAAQKEHYRSKVKKQEERIQELEKQLQQLNKEKKAPLSDDEWKQKIEFVVKHRDVPPEFIDEIEAYARGRSISLEDAYKSEVIQSAYKALQEKGRKEEKIPAPSSRSTIVEGKDISQMSKEEIKKNYDKIVSKFMKSSHPKYE
ncbi:MAG: hypothetical protein KBH94_05015 [Caldisericia bacterium]|nr:hypothetical protein [Caldisericia bacterium]HPZ74857.1 hypothetical protein [Candidatus Pacearchaeota archaeon]